MKLITPVLNLLPRLWGNWISILGTTLTTVAGNAILIVAVIDIVTDKPNNYTSTVAYLLMPMLFVLGLAVIATGVWRQQRRPQPEEPKGPLARAVDIVVADRSARRRVTFVIGATLLNLTLISVAAFKSVTYMDSPQFCGTLCHSVMKPEYTAYQRSPHARVPCVDCHIGEGADWFARSKLSGMRQVWATITQDFSRPIPTPIHHLRPARETCQKCHWPAQFHGARLLVRDVYKSDEHNTRLTNVVQLHVGGVDRRTNRYVGIHWHVGPDVHIEYEALDERRTRIGKVELTTPDGKHVVFEPPKGQGGGKVYERRLMDCVDCHNRPTHIYDPTPEVAVDQALSLGKLDAGLPFLRQQAVALLRTKIADTDQAAARFTEQLQAYYRKSYAELAQKKAAQITKAGRELGWIYRRNVYPELKISWGTYPSHIGHRQTSEGCFRCHDDEHKTKDGKTIPQDCDLCHDVLAEEEEKPDVPESVLQLGRM